MKLLLVVEGFMHEPVRSRVEDLLKENGSREATQESVASHLQECPECSGEISTMRAQSQFFSTLRSPAEMEPAPGFYARVMQRIEDRGLVSIWSVFLDSPFGNRLALASFSVALALGTYVITSEALDGQLAKAAHHLHHFDLPVIGSQADQRDAVLENFAVHLQNSSATQRTLP